MKKLLLLTAITVALFVATASAQTGYLLNGSVAVPAGKVWRNTFDVTSNIGKVYGKFQAEGGGNNDIFCYIVSEDDYVNLINGNEFRSYYSSGKVTIGTINIRLARGRYVLVFSNTHSTFSAKTVYGTVALAQ